MYSSASMRFLLTAMYALCACLWVSLASAQDATEFVIYDAVTGDLSKSPPYSTSQDGQVIFQVNNLNLFLYDVALVESQNNIVNSTTLEKNTTSIAVDPINFNLDDVTIRIPMLSIRSDDTTALLRRKVEEARVKYQRALETLDGLRTQLTKLETISGELREVKLRMTADSVRIQQLEKKGAALTEEEKVALQAARDANESLTIEKTVLDGRYRISGGNEHVTVKNEVDKQKKEVERLRDTLDEEEWNLEEAVEVRKEWDLEFHSRLKAYQASLADLNKVVDFYQQIICVMYSSGRKFEEIQAAKYAAVVRFFGTGVVDANQILDNSQGRLAKVEDSFRSLNEAYAKIVNKGENEALMTRIRAFHEQLRFGAYRNFFVHVTKVYSAIVPENYTLRYRTLIITDNADEINFILSARPTANVPCAISPKPIRLAYNVRLKEGLKLDFSAGLFGVFGLASSTYRFETVRRLRPMEEFETFVVEDEPETEVLPAVGVLIHVYKRHAGRDVRLGGTIGASTDANSLKYFLGASLMLGRSQRFVLSGGLAVGRVNKPQAEFSPGRRVMIEPADLPATVGLRDPAPYKFGWFVGFTFNLTGRASQATLSQVARI